MDLTQSIEARSDQIERWLPVVGYEGAYEVSDLGRVRALSRITDRGRRWRGRELRASTMPHGYRIVTLWRDGAQSTALVHRLVLTAFVGPPTGGQEALHADGDPANNELANLSWGSHSANMLDQVAHGTHANASKDSCPSGHAYDEANTYTYPGPSAHRACRTCRRTYQREYQRKLRALRKAS